MVLEKVKLIDGTEAEIQCKHLSPRRAFSLLKNVLKVTEMQPCSIEVTENGKTILKESQKMVGEFSGIVELVPLAIEDVVCDCPQKEMLTITEMKRLYEKYAANVIKEAMTTVSPKL